MATIVRSVGVLRFSRRIVSECTSKRRDHHSRDGKFSQLKEGPSLTDFIRGTTLNDVYVASRQEHVPYVQSKTLRGQKRKVFLEVYGCQMNTNDTEIVWSILKSHDYQRTTTLKDADVVLMMTCAIRDGAEDTVWNRLKHLRQLKGKREAGGEKLLQIGVLGCMAERLKKQLVEKEQSVDVVAGPDAYKDLPRLLAIGQNGQKAINVLLSLDETYADVVPVKLDRKSKTAYVSIMRGCDNMCSYCIVPFTRGKERSRPIISIRDEIINLESKGFREITLLGQNVNSYQDKSVESAKSETKEATVLAPGFRTVYKTKIGGVRFAELLSEIAEIVPEMRIRFTSPHPKDFPTDVLETIAKYSNICSNLHLPAQSGSSAVLDRMRRGYSREAYINLVTEVRKVIPDVTLSSDFICGFCGETQDEFADTISLIKEVGYHAAYLFAYSMREKTTAHRRYRDDIPEDVKKDRLRQMIVAYRTEAERLNRAFVGRTELILVENFSKRSRMDLAGRNDGNVRVIIPAGPIRSSCEALNNDLQPIGIGDYVAVRITSSNSQILKGEALYHSSITQFYDSKINGSISRVAAS
ncbi:CDK5RAP1-like protein [Anopheles ziemanni]|uniref:CDK5RAP1-like protein n=1 Tax=Anopheles coustani TaxID=139045 RepID=UPI00265932D3|nr:CDK5RAP1-like protein [Anopheles coustani]XP_058171383.1 CDK5RAP1-like protein [Anopheles ziemanni]